MSKWYKVYVPITHFDDITEVGYFLEELQPEGRWKSSIYHMDKNNRQWCFKFKDEIAATAFKLRWT